MHAHEPFATAFVCLVVALLLGISVLASRASRWLSVPIVLIFLVIGMVAGSEGIGGIAFENYRLAFQAGTAALVLILFDGGLNTKRSVVTEAFWPAVVLASAGVVATAAAVAGIAHVLGLPWNVALLLGAVVSSTDAATVFSVLRGSGLRLHPRVGAVLEMESGANDPAAVILTLILTQRLLAPEQALGWFLLREVIQQIGVGCLAGFAVGYGGRWLLARVPLPASGLYPVLTLSFALLSFGASTLLGGSGFLSVYIAGILIGNGEYPHRSWILFVHDALAWLSQIAMFLMLGLLVFPSRLVPVAGIGLTIALVLALIIRPAVVAACLAGFRYRAREATYLGWVGLRGAVPVVLSTFPVLMGAPGAERLFNIVFFIVVVNAIIPGATVPWVTRRLGVERHATPETP